MDIALSFNNKTDFHRTLTNKLRRCEMKRTIVFLSIVLLTISLSFCSTKQEQPQSPGEIAKAFFLTLSDGEFEIAESYMSPAMKSRLSQEHKAFFGSNIQNIALKSIRSEIGIADKVEIISEDIKADKATVKCEIHCRGREKAVTTSFKKIDDVWKMDEIIK
jgi:hypothetical protein